MFRTALRNVLAHKARLLMTVLAVMLGVAFVSGTLVFTATASSDAYRASSDRRATSTSPSPSPPKSDRRRRRRPERTSTPAPLTRAGQAPRRRRPPPAGVDGFAAVADTDGKPLGNGTSSPRRQLRPGGGRQGRPLPAVAEARGPTGTHEVALDDAHRRPRAATRSATPCASARQGAVLTTPSAASSAPTTPRSPPAAASTLFDTATAQKLFLEPGHYDEHRTHGRTRHLT